MSDTEKVAPTAPRLPDLNGGHVAVDFVNSVEWRGRQGPDRGEFLVSYETFLAWAAHVGLLEPGEAAVLVAEARRRPGDADAALAEAIELREALHELLHAAEHGAEPPAAALAVLNAAVTTALASSTLEPSDGGYRWRWSDCDDDLRRPALELARLAADLLASHELAHVRSCGNAECGWWFVDTSRGHRRRWCSMEACGNRAKARRHYARTRRAPAT